VSDRLLPLILTSPSNSASPCTFKVFGVEVVDRVIVSLQAGPVPLEYKYCPPLPEFIVRGFVLVVV
jgi:hypothetical protein